MSSKPEDLHEVLIRLAEVIKSRRDQSQTKLDTSYVAKLFSKGDDAILKKIGEEAAEAIMAAKDCRHSMAGGQINEEQKALLIGEVADLWFHCLVMLAQFDCTPEDVLAELARREGMSGLEEKASRKPL